MSWWDNLKQAVWPPMNVAWTTAADMQALERGLHAVRDQADCAAVRADCASRIGCTPERLTEVLTAIADAAHAADP